VGTIGKKKGPMLHSDFKKAHPTRTPEFGEKKDTRRKRKPFVTLQGKPAERGECVSEEWKGERASWEEENPAKKN